MSLPRFSARAALLGLGALALGWSAATAAETTPTIQYHAIRTDAHGRIIPWSSPDLGASYDEVIRLTARFWHHMAPDRNGLPYYMNHQVWRPDLDDHRGIGGDQFAMALSSWGLLFRYLGNQSTDEVRYDGARWGALVEDMRFIADYYLTHGLSAPADAWPFLPYPYNTAIYSGIYDGDMVLGRGYTQPDKAGSFGHELVNLYKITGQTDYLDAALRIADTLAAHVVPGDHEHSPLPFKVHAVNGEIGRLHNDDGSVAESNYTSNWSGTLRLFAELGELGRAGLPELDGHLGHADPARFRAERLAAYQRGFDLILAWMKAEPLRTNKWGPFFEDVPGWSDTQINAVTFAEFILDHRSLFPHWQAEVRGIFDWVHHELGNHTWDKYGVTVIDEQTAYRVPGNSHTSRQAAAELHYAALSGDPIPRENAIRQLSWATYTVAADGRNRYIQDDIWLTDGYGDYVRHYLRAMAAAPELAPAGQDHIIDCDSVISRARYAADRITYRTFDRQATTTLRLTRQPKTVSCGTEQLPALTENNGLRGWNWEPQAGGGGLLRVHHEDRGDIVIAFPQ